MRPWPPPTPEPKRRGRLRTEGSGRGESMGGVFWALTGTAEAVVGRTAVPGAPATFEGDPGEVGACAPAAV